MKNTKKRSAQNREIITQITLKRYPDVQAIYLFGSLAQGSECPESDVDLALLFHHDKAAQIAYLAMSETRFELEEFLNRKVDLINLRTANTVFQKEIIMADARIYCGDQYAAAEFEMLTISKYQALNEDRKGILEEAFKSGRFLRL